MNEDLRGKMVEVGTGDMRYFGKLIEINEEEIYLESEGGWIAIPVANVAFVKEKED